jgi:tetratricopeptide (TPR) repeat protein
LTSAGKIGLLLATIVITVAIYFLGDFKGKGKVKEETPTEETVSKFDYLLYKETLLQKLEPVKRQALENLEKNLGNASSEVEKIAALNQLIAECEQQKLELMATMYSKDIASIKNEADLWDKTGTYFMGLFYNLQEEPAVQTFKLEEARACFVKATELDSANLEYQVRLGVTFMEDQTQTMQGVQLLLGVVEKDSTHISANLYLGRFGIISGQFDKAISRLNTVLNADSANIEAYILMADAQAGKGDKAKAIEYLEKVKTLVPDPEFQANIDAYIEKIKNS